VSVVSVGDTLACALAEAGTAEEGDTLGESVGDAVGGGVTVPVFDAESVPESDTVGGLEALCEKLPAESDSDANPVVEAEMLSA
jgi:hypothetical protein